MVKKSRPEMVVLKIKTVGKKHPGAYTAYTCQFGRKAIYVTSKQVGSGWQWVRSSQPM